MSFANFSGQLISNETGGFVTQNLGTLSTTLNLNRQPTQVGPVPSVGANGVFTVDLSAYSGFSINVTVNSTNPDCYPFMYADAVPDPLPVTNLTDFGDALRGKRCQRTGLWVPASRVKYVKGIPFLDVVAPELINQIIPEPPFIKQVSGLGPPQTGPYNKGG